MTKIVGFYSNKLTLRGTEVALYDYAHYNEKILGNKSIIITRDYEKIKNEFDVDILAYEKFKNRFQVYYYETPDDIQNIININNITHMYMIKFGNKDSLIFKNCKNIVHCVFFSFEQHGDIYATVGHCINNTCNTNYPVVPHMVVLPNSNENLRKQLNIPNNAIVFGRYGGTDTFDIQFVHVVIKNILDIRNDIYFLFINTDIFYKHKNIFYLSGNTDMLFKRKFINTCDALLHARFRGETFGLTCGEFAICEKPVITWGGSRETEHLIILKDKAVIYYTFEELMNILWSFTKDKYDMKNNGYMLLTPEYVMNIFNNTFLN
jgi:hypothetical protein